MPDTPPSPDHIMQIGMGFWASKTLLSAVELGLFTELAKQPESLDTLQNRLGLHSRSARDFLDALVSLGLLDRENGVYENTPSTDFFLDKNKPSYIGTILEMSNQRLYPFWGQLTEALLTGEPQNEGKNDPDYFKILYSDPARLKGFVEAMSGVSRGANMAIAAKFDWSKYNTFVDLGCAQGDLPAQISLQNPHLTGIGFDLPQVKPIFDEYITDLGLADRLKFQGGDFFNDPIPSTEVVLLGHILHDWNLEEKRALLASAYESLPEGGAIVVYDAIIDNDRRENTFGLLLSLNMLIETPGGFDYTAADCIDWMTKTGFRDVSVHHLLGPDSMVVGIK